MSPFMRIRRPCAALRDIPEQYVHRYEQSREQSNSETGIEVYPWEEATHPEVYPWEEATHPEVKTGRKGEERA